MPLLTGPLRLPVDLPYLDRYCFLAWDSDGAVLLDCGACPVGHTTLAWIGPANLAPASAVVVDDITGLIDAGMRHVREYHPEP